jgi:acetyltransferase-like isoleucine patch superfamily enzyme
MKNIRKMIKNKISYILNTKKREKFFKYISSEHKFNVQETKHSYELIFEDKTKTILPKSLFSFIKRWNLTDRPEFHIGKSTYLQNLKLDIFYDEHVKIGSFCSFGPNVVIKIDGVRGKIQFTQYPLNLIDEQSHVYNARIEEIRNYFVHIGNDCFIGEDVLIMANVTIHDGVIIGERSLVPSNKVLESFGIYAGIPVKLIGYRYSPEIILELQRIQWWRWSLEKIQSSGLQHINFQHDPNVLDILRSFK